MEISGPALTALFVALVWTLIKVVEFLISKYKTNNTTVDLSSGQYSVLKNIGNNVNSLVNSIVKQEEALTKILLYSEHLDNMHSVYNEDHVPSWYTPTDMIKLTRDNNNISKMMFKEMDENMDEFKNGQDIIVNKITELISSQRLMTERLGDLISTLNKTNH